MRRHEVRFVQTAKSPTHDGPSPAERTSELLAKLDAEVQALTDSETWQRYLVMQARLHKYSFGNVLLIAMQHPGATHVAGYQAWRSLGRYVRKGEQGIRILVPYVFRAKQDEQQDGEGKAESYVRFGTGHVFDISQTDGDEAIVEWGYVHGDEHAAGLGLRRLEMHARQMGYSVERCAEAGQRRGHCDFSSKRIVLDAGLDTVNATAVLAHEFAHALLHEGITDYQANRGLYEVEAESVAYVVVTGLGLDASACALPYVASWSRGTADDSKTVRTLGERVHKTASALLAVADVSEEIAA